MPSATACASYYEVYGSGDQTLLLLPTWSIVHSRFWKAQIPYLARHFRVVTFDGRGNGRSDRPVGADAYIPDEFAADALAVMDATATERAALVALSCGALWATILAAEHPERVDGVVYIGPAVGLAPGHPEREVHRSTSRSRPTRGGPSTTATTGSATTCGFLEFFFAKCFNEPHSSKQIEDCIGWALETDPETLADTTRGIGLRLQDRELRGDLRARALPDARDPRRRGPGPPACPGRGARRGDRRASWSRCKARATSPTRATRSRSTCCCASSSTAAGRPPPPGGAPVRAGGARSTSPRRSASATRSATSRSPTSCASSTPTSRSTGSRSTRSPRCSRRRGERIHPASAELANESGHIESESAEHDLHAFQAIRRMDEILVANFMVFHDLVAAEQYDLWIGDEAWELDYFLHENPELKTAAYVWLTDFVGWLPMTDGGAREEFLTADYNAEMIEQIARYPRVRDRAVFVGDPDDIVPERFGPELPAIRDWTEQHYSFAGYVTGFDPAAFADREALRAELGYRPDERVCIVTVGGSGVGARPPAPGDRELPGGEAPRPGAADDRRRRTADRPRIATNRPTGSRSAPTCPTSTGTSPPATSRSSREG